MSKHLSTKIAFVYNVYVCVCPLPRLLIISGAVASLLQLSKMVVLMLASVNNILLNFTLDASLINNNYLITFKIWESSYTKV